MSRRVFLTEPDRAGRIRALQTMLQCAGMYDGELNGSWDEATQEALRRFRLENGFSDEAVADVAVWERLRQVCGEVREHTEPPRGIHPFPSSERRIVLGERSDLVLLLQMMLNTLRLRYDQYDHLPLHGLYDEETERAIRAFRRVHRLPDDGAVDVVCWNRLASDYDSLIQEIEGAG